MNGSSVCHSHNYYSLLGSKSTAREMYLKMFEVLNSDLMDITISCLKKASESKPYSSILSLLSTALPM